MLTAKAEASSDFVLLLLAREGRAWVQAASSSMSPLIQPGDRLHLRALDPGGARAGMIVAFRRDGVLIVHRVLAETPAGLVTGGDALVDADAPTRAGELVARVVAIRSPRGRRIDLERCPWPAIGRGLAAVARLRAASPVARRALRIPFHLAAALGR
jgi:signal peptidase I